MKKSILGAAFAAAAAMVVTQANATVTHILTLTSATDFGAFLTVNADGTLHLAGDETEYTGVKQQDKLFDGFGLKAGQTVTFSFSTIDGVDTHTIAFGGTLSSKNPTNFAYDISVFQGTNYIDSTSSDLSQTKGVSTLDETLTPGGASAIKFTKTNSTGYAGSTDFDFSGTPKFVSVSEILTPGPKGTNVSSVVNSWVESPSAPGPLPGAGLLGSAALLGFLLTAKARASRG